METDQLEFSILTERPVVRSDQSSDIDVAIDLATSKSIEAHAANYAINLCVVVDRSGSMDGVKLEHAKKSCLDIYDSLNSNDRFTVLAFDTEVISVVNPQTPPTQIRDRIQALKSGGTTDLSKGWYLGLLELQTYASEKHINRLILLSDGQANAGEKKPSVLGSESSRARNELGITTSTIGIGSDFQEDILAALALESGGRFWYIGEARIEDIIKEEFSGALSVLLERPGVELSLPPGVSIGRELNNLPKISNRYRLRPIKSNDRFSFALRLRVDPTLITDNVLKIGATLLDGAGLVQQAELLLPVGSIEEYVQSPENPNVTTIVSKFLAATSDEKIVEEMDAGNVSTMLEMLQSQSALMKDLEAKLTGVRTISWETMTERDREQAENERRQRDHELVRLRMEIEENQALVAVGQLVDLMLGLGQSETALHLLGRSRKMHRQRSVRNKNVEDRHEMDDWAAQRVLEQASEDVDRLVAEFPHLQEQLADIRRRIDEQLAHFS